MPAHQSETMGCTLEWYTYTGVTIRAIHWNDYLLLDWGLYTRVTPVYKSETDNYIE